MDLDIRMDLEGAMLGLAQLSDNHMRASINRSLTRAANSTAKHANKLIREGLNLKGSAKRGMFGESKLIVVRRALSGSIMEQTASVTIKAQGAALTDFRGTRQTKRGLSVQIYKGRPRKVLKGRFIYPGRRGGVSAERMMMSTGRVPRGPIKLLFAPGLAQYASKPRILGALRDHAQERFGIELERDVAYRLAGAVPGRRGRQPVPS